MDSQIKTCFLFGHRDTPDDILPALEAAIKAQYASFGIRCFIVGHYGNFDKLASIALRNVKAKLVDMRLQMLIPYHPALQNIVAPDGFDGTYYPDGLEQVPLRYRIVAANRKIVSIADTVICYVKYVGNAKDLLKLAIDRKIPIHNLATVSS